MQDHLFDKQHGTMYYSSIQQEIEHLRAVKENLDIAFLQKRLDHELHRVKRYKNMVRDLIAENTKLKNLFVGKILSSVGEKKVVRVKSQAWKKLVANAASRAPPISPSGNFSLARSYAPQENAAFKLPTEEKSKTYLAGKVQNAMSIGNVPISPILPPRFKDFNINMDCNSQRRHFSLAENKKVRGYGISTKFSKNITKNRETIKMVRRNNRLRIVVANKICRESYNWHINETSRAMRIWHENTHLPGDPSNLPKSVAIRGVRNEVEADNAK